MQVRFLFNDFQKLISCSWSIKVMGCPMYSLDKKLKLLKTKLKD